MQITIHIDNKDLPLLTVQSWLRPHGYRLVYKPDGSVHAVPAEPSEVKTLRPKVLPFHRPVHNPFGAV